MLTTKSTRNATWYNFVNWGMSWAERLIALEMSFDSTWTICRLEADIAWYPTRVFEHDYQFILATSLSVVRTWPLLSECGFKPWRGESVSSLNACPQGKH